MSIIYGQTIFSKGMHIRVTSGDDKDKLGTIQGFSSHTDIHPTDHGQNHYIEQTYARVLFDDGDIRGVYPWNMVPHYQKVISA